MHGFSRASGKLAHRFALAIPLMALLVVGVTLFPSAGRDDAYISYWPGHALAETGELTNYNGEHIEQSSSLLQVLVLAALHRISGIEVELLGPLITILAGELSIVAVYVLARRAMPGSEFGAALLLSTSVFFVYWTFGGLETTLASLAIILIMLAYGDYLLTARPQSVQPLVLCIGTTLVFLLVRPEMPIVLACVLVGTTSLVVLRRVLPGFKPIQDERRVLLRLAILAGIALAVAAAIVSFRLGYFGSAVPQPVSAKTGGDFEEVFRLGREYLSQTLFASAEVTRFTLPVIVALVIALGLTMYQSIRAPAINPYSALSGMFVVVYTAFILLAGGDWMEGGRFLAHMLPLVMLFVALGLTQVLRHAVLRWGFTVGLVALQVGFAIYFAQHSSTGLPIKAAVSQYKTFGLEAGAEKFNWFERTNRVHMRDIPVIGFLNQAIEQIAPYSGGRVTIMSGQMGMIAYHLAKDHYGEIYFYDQAGLVGPNFMKCALLAPDLVHMRNGTILFYGVYFEHWEDLDTACNIPKPDIVYALGTDGWEFASRGYTIMFNQVGAVRSGSSSFPGGSVQADQYVAIRNDLLFTLGDMQPVTLQFEDLQDGE
jgi:hypothetical protein